MRGRIVLLALLSVLLAARAEASVEFGGSNFALGYGQYNPDVVLDVQPVGDPLSPTWDHSVCLADITRTESTVAPDPCGSWPRTGIHTFIQLENPTRVERVIDRDGAFGNGRPAYTAAQAAGEEGRTVAADAHYGAARAYDFFKTLFKRNQVGTFHNRLRIVVNKKTESGTHWDEYDETIYVARPGGQGVPVTADMETIGHEYAHALMSVHMGGMYETPLSKQGTEYGALEEGIADVFGVLIDAFGTDPANSSLREPIDWVIGDRSFPDLSRRFDVPSLGNDPGWDRWDPSRNIEMHQAGGVMRRAFYLMTYGIEPDGHVGVGSPGIGLPVSTKLLYDTITQGYVTGDAPSFLHFRETMLRFAEDKLKVCTPGYKTVMDAWATVNVGLPADRTPPKVKISATRINGGAHAVVEVYTKVGERAPRSAQIKLDGQPVKTIALQASSNPLLCRVWIGSATESCYIGETDVLFTPAVTNRLSATADDGCMNFASHEIVVDYAAPTNLEIAENGNPISPRRYFRVAAQDGSALAAYRVEAAGVSTTGAFGPSARQAFTSAMDFGPVADGPVLLKLTVTDVHRNSASKTVPFHVDKTPPSCSFGSKGRDGQNLFVEIHASDRSPGILRAMVIYGPDGREVARANRHDAPLTVIEGTARLRYTLVNPPNGTHRFTAMCVDEWGNETHPETTVTQSPPPALSVSSQASPTSFSASVVVRSTYSRIARVEWKEGGVVLRNQYCLPESECRDALPSRSASAGQRRVIEVRAWDVEGRESLQTETIDIPQPQPPPLPRVAEQEPNQWERGSLPNQYHQLQSGSLIVTGSMPNDWDRDAFLVPLTSGQVTVVPSTNKRISVQAFVFTSSNNWTPVADAAYTIRGETLQIRHADATYMANRPVTQIMLWVLRDTSSQDSNNSVSYELKITR